MNELDVVWVHRPDPLMRRRVRTQVRFGALGVSVLLVALGWVVFGVAGGLAGLALMVFITLTVESWARGGPDDTAHWIWLDGQMLCADGPELYVREVGADAFEHVPEPPGRVIRLDELAWASVYPSVTDDQGRRDFHLVVDLATGDGERRCLVLDRRIPFRIGGELALAEAIGHLVGHRWRDPSGDDTFGDDAFGELDRRRLADWSAAGHT